MARKKEKVFGGHKLRVHMGKLGIEHKHTHRVPHSKISISGKSQTHLGDNPGASSRPLLHIVADLITLKPSLTDG